MNKPKNPSIENTELRRRAELQHGQSITKEGPPPMEVESQRLVHELQVHQIELEMQNEELRQARAEVEAGLERYTDLYDFAPVGYITLNREGTISQANLYSARLLGVERSSLVDRRFGIFIDSNDRFTFDKFLKDVFERRVNEVCEVTLTKEKNDNLFARESSNKRSPDKVIPYLVQIEAALAEDGQTCRAVVIDITERKQNEASLRLLVDQNVRRTEELESLTEVSAAMRQAKTIAALMPVLVVQSMNALKAQAGVLALLEGTTLEFTAGVGKMEFINGHELAVENDILWDIVCSGEPRVIYNPPANDDHFERNSFFATLSHSLGACIIAPLKREHTTFGLLILGYGVQNPISTNQLRLVNAISDMAGNALHRMRATEALEKMAANRTLALETIYRVTSAASESINLNSVFRRALGLILPAVSANAGSIFLFNEDTNQIDLVVDEGLADEVSSRIKTQAIENSLEGWVIRNKKALLLPNSAFDPNLDWNIQTNEFQVCARLPMRVHDRVVGVLSVSRTNDQQFNVDEMTLLSFIANHLGLIVENIQLYKQEEHHALLKERSRMARELHDSTIQILFSAGLFSTGAQDAINSGNLELVSSNLKQSNLLIQQALIEMRLMVYELRSQALSEKGLIAAVKHRLDSVEKRSGMSVSLKNDDLPPLTSKMENGLYRIIIEALNNTLKHARANHLRIEISRSENKLTTFIQDNGVGFDPGLVAQKGGHGLSSMKERVQMLQGVFEINSAPGNGTRISFSIPIESS